MMPIPESSQQPHLSASAALCSGVSLGSRTWSVQELDSRTQETLCNRTTGNGHTAPSILIPRHGGEPLRLDTHFPAHPRGSGREWPPEARVGKGSGSGRFPLAAAWSDRHSERRWRWTIDGEEHEVASMDAVSAAFRQLVDWYVHAPKCALVIPNDMPQRHQQRILDECFDAAPSVSLLWRPIAAALAVLDRADTTLSPPQGFRNSTCELMVLYADWGQIECTRLQLIPFPDHDPEHWIPARRRPNVSDLLLPGFGWELTRSRSEANLAADWERLFVSNAAKDYFNPDINERASGESMVRAIAGWSLDQSAARECVEQIQSFMTESSEDLAGVVVLGDFAGELTTNATWRGAMQRIKRTHPNCVSVVAPTDEGERILAYGAARHLQKLEAGEVSYFDTLPSLELFVDRMGEYEWKELLDVGNRFVEGGKEWTLDGPIRGLAIPRGASRLKMVVAHEEFTGVREVSANLGESAEQRIPAELHVSCTPAQGNARLMLQTEAQGGTPSRSIHANWNRMIVMRDENGNEIGRDEYLAAQPRAFPELMPRRSSGSRWGSAIRHLKNVINKVKIDSPNAVIDEGCLLRQVKASLMQKDQNQTPHDATAIGSDFTAPFDQAMLEKAADTFLLIWKVFRDAPRSNVNTVVRILGYLSVDDPAFESWLVNNLSNQMQDQQCVLHSTGLVLRDPRNISRFLSAIFPDYTDYPPNANQLKAASQILRYRAEATRDIESDAAERYIEMCLGVFEDGMDRGGGSYPFRWSSLIIVYLLRRRMYDNEFLAPDGELAQRAKQLFESAISEHRRGIVVPLGGSVDLPAALNQMIAYIEKRGSGDILMAAE